VMATLAYLLEKAVLRSIRRGRGKPEPLEYKNFKRPFSLTRKVPLSE
jgi:hypothetical protein